MSNNRIDLLETEKQYVDLIKKLIIEKKIENIDAEIAEQFVDEQERQIFYQQFYSYMIVHAYEIYEQQMDQFNDELRLNNIVTEKKREKLSAKKITANHSGSQVFPENVDDYIKMYHPKVAISINNNATNCKANPAALVVLNESKKPYQQKYNDLCNQINTEAEAELINEKMIFSENIAKQLVNTVKKLIEKISKDEEQAWIVARKFGIGGTKVKINGIRYILPEHVALIYAKCSEVEKMKSPNYLAAFNGIAELGKKAANKKPLLNIFGLYKRDKKTQNFYDLYSRAYQERNNKKR